MVADFSFYVPANIKFGRGKIDTLGAETARIGRKAFIVTGKSSAATGLLEKAQKSLENSGVESVVFDKITQNPLTTSVEEGAKLLKETGCDCIVAIGGGSPLDASKGIAVLARQGGELDDYIFKKFQGVPEAVPIIAVPTTCGTGSESNGTAILSNPVTLDKKSMSYTSTVPACSIVDPALMETIPKKVIGQVTFDALCHSMESYFSPTANPFTEPLSMNALMYLSKYMVRINDDIHDEEAVDGVTLASTMVGAAFFSSGLQAPHGMEHPLSGMKNIAHGKGLAALTPVIYEHSYSADPAKFSMISRMLGGTDGSDCARTIRQLLNRIDLEIYLSDEGFSEDDIPWLVDNCFKVSRARVEGHVKPLDREEVRQIYLESL